MPPTGEIMDRLAQMLARSAVKEPLYHGSPHPFEQLSTKFIRPQSRFGPGIYLTDNPSIASSVADWPLRPTVSRSTGLAPNVRQVFLDAQNPLDMQSTPTTAQIKSMQDYFTQKAFRPSDSPGSAPTGERLRMIRALLRGTASELAPDEDFATLLMRHTIHPSPIPEIVNQGIRKATGADAFRSQLARDDLGAHTEYVAFDPKKILNPWTLTPASILAAIAAGRQSLGPSSPIDTEAESL